MRSLSAETKALIARLHEPVSLRDRVFGTAIDVTSLLGAIGEAGEPAAIPSLVPFLLDRREDVVASAAGALTRLVSALSPTDRAWLDEQMRNSSLYWSGEWPRLRPETLARFLRLQEASATVMGLASSHASGYVREAAIRHLATMADGSELPFLLIRLNDWVAPVRDRALQALQARVTPEYAGHFLWNLPLVFRLRESGRADHSAFVARVTDLLKSEPSRPALWSGITSGDRQTARCCFRLACELAGEELQPVIEFGLRARDPLIRLWAARKVAAAFDGTALRDVLARMKRDRFVPVRREALIAALERVPEVASIDLREALLDPHPAVRAFARYALGKRETLDFAAFYRDALARGESTVLAATLMGLAETGTAGDAALVRPHVTSPLIRTRRSALRGLARLDADTYLDVFREALRDDVPSVTREARDTLSARIYRVDIGWVWSVFREEDRPHVRKAALFLITCLGKWERISYLVRAVGDLDPVMARQAGAYVSLWIGAYNRSFTRPTAEQLNRLAEAIRESEAALEPGLLQELRAFHSFGVDLLPPSERGRLAHGRWTRS